MESRSCSWCHALNDVRAVTCRNCGHNAHVPRLHCTCEQCVSPPFTRAEQEQLEALADFYAEGELSQELAPTRPEAILTDIVRDGRLVAGIMLWPGPSGGFLGAWLDARMGGVREISGSTPWQPMPTVQAVLESLQRAAGGGGHHGAPAPAFALALRGVTQEHCRSLPSSGSS
jgi:hypothetical protein